MTRRLVITRPMNGGDRHSGNPPGSCGTKVGGAGRWAVCSPECRGKDPCDDVAGTTTKADKLAGKR